MIDMLKRPEGATVEQIAAATGWQHHTIRGAISGALKKKLGLTVEATRTREVGPNKTGAKGSSHRLPDRRAGLIRRRNRTLRRRRSLAPGGDLFEASAVASTRSPETFCRRWTWISGSGYAERRSDGGNGRRTPGFLNSTIVAPDAAPPPSRHDTKPRRGALETT